MRWRDEKIVRGLLLTIIFAATPLLNAASTSASRRRTPQLKSAAGHHRRRLSSRRAKSAGKPRRPNAYQRLAKMQMDPGRVESIQKALSDAGAYHGNPTGQWDSETRAAMMRYQSQNGFAATGLPDAKSLMKMGLGPHPLPSELDKTRAGNLDPNSAAASSPVRADLPSGDTTASPNLAPPPAQDPPKR